MFHRAASDTTNQSEARHHNAGREAHPPLPQLPRPSALLTPQSTTHERRRRQLCGDGTLCVWPSGNRKGHFSVCTSAVSGNTVATCHFFHLTCDFQFINAAAVAIPESGFCTPLKLRIFLISRFIYKMTQFFIVFKIRAPPGICHISGAIFNFPEARNKGLLTLSAAATRANVFVPTCCS